MANSCLYFLQCNQVGLQINLNQPTGGISFANATCYLFITDPNGNEVTYPAEVDATNTYAFYITLGNEFPIPGIYVLQLKYTTAGGERYYGNLINVKAIGNLAA